jgi:hypothetical protein
MTLPVLVKFHDDETRLSLLSRLARANGYSSLTEFLSFTNTSARAVRSGEPKAVLMLAEWSGVDPSRLASFEIKNSGPGATWKLGKATMSKDMRLGHNYRYCPQCVLEDLEHGQGRPPTRPYVRTTWMTKAFATCLQHGRPIVERATDALGQEDFSRFAAANLAIIEKQSAADFGTSPAMKMDEYVAARIDGRLTNPFLDSFEAYVAIDLCRYLGHFEKKHRPAGQSRSREIDSVIENGFAIASEGAEYIEATIVAAVDLEKPFVVELKSFFGLLRTWLLRNREKEEFGPAVELFQDIVKRNLPVGKDDFFLVPTRQRHIHSVRSAGLEYNMMEERVYKVVVDAGLAQPSELSSARIYFNAADAHELLIAALDTVTSADMASAMGVSTARIRAILDHGLIPRASKVSDGTRVYSRVRRPDFERFLETIDGHAPHTAETGDLMDLRKASAKAYCNVEKILELILDGKISSLRRAHGDGFIAGLVIDATEVRGLLMGKGRSASNGTHARVYEALAENPKLLNGRQAEQRLRTTSGTITELVNLGYLETVEAVNSMTKRSRRYICAASLAAFDKGHVSVAMLATKTKVFGGSIPPLLDAKGIRPIYEPTGRNSRYYRIADVIGAFP